MSEQKRWPVLKVAVPPWRYAQVMEIAKETETPVSKMIRDVIEPWLDATLEARAGTKDRAAPVRTATRLTIEQIVTERMDAETFFARMASAGYDDEQAEESTQARAASLKRGTIRDGQEDGRYFIEPTGVKP